MNDIVWLNWRTTCRRNREFCRYFNIEPVVMPSNRFGLIGLLDLIVRTFVYLNRARPCVLMTTSLRIALLAILLRPIFRYRLVVDCHYSGIVPNPSIPSFLHWLYPFIHRRADLIVVTNRPHAEQVQACGGRSLILQDRIPVPGPAASTPDRGTASRVVFICSYNNDEPMDEILSAVRMLDENDIEVYYTGDNRGRFRPGELPERVVLTGYLPEEQYWQLLHGADLVVDLTTRENCLLCGAYEAVAVGKPMVLSNSSALTGYFTKGVVYTENRADAIAQGIITALTSRDRLGREVAELKRELLANWEQPAELLRLVLARLCQQAKTAYSRLETGAFNG